MTRTTRVSIVGSGFLAKGLVFAFESCPDLLVSKVLTRGLVEARSDFPGKELLTNSVAELLDGADVVVECSGDAIHATDVVAEALDAGLPVVTMNCEFQVTTGSYFTSKGILTEAEGDQPGVLAALRKDALQMGFEPLVYGNIKGFLDHTPTRESMQYWAEKQGISLQQVTSFTDGTKLQIEQAMVANAFDADIAQPGLIGEECDDLRAAGERLAETAKFRGCPLSDYVLSRKLPPGVFIVAEHDEAQQPYLKYLKLGDGPFYTLLHNFHLCHLEVAKTVRMVVNGEGVLLDNSANPRISVAAVAKRSLQPGETIAHGIGSFDVRGIAVAIADDRDHVPIGLLSNAVVKRRVEPEQQLTFDDVEIPESLAAKCWDEIREKSLGQGREEPLDAGVSLERR